MPKPLIGIGLRHLHLEQFIDQKPDIGWVEVHSENFYSLGGPTFDKLVEIRNHYPVSLHGIGMSLGSVSVIDEGHISQVKNLIEAIDPFMVSDHLSWSSSSERFLPDLLPTPFDDESLKVFTNNISIVQDRLRRKILVENPSTYFEYVQSTYTESEFLNILSEKTGAGILLDVNNAYISNLNNGWSVEKYINDIQFNSVEEIHVSGHSVKKISDSASLYIDSHDDRVCDNVWKLYQRALKCFGNVPTLVEWDINIPKLEVLLDEAYKARFYLKKIK